MRHPSLPAESEATLDPELLEFLDDDAPGPAPDPAFRARLRASLWDMVGRLYGSRETESDDGVEVERTAAKRAGR